MIGFPQTICLDGEYKEQNTEIEVEMTETTDENDLLSELCVPIRKQ